VVVTLLTIYDKSETSTLKVSEIRLLVKEFLYQKADNQEEEEREDK